MRLGRGRSCWIPNQPPVSITMLPPAAFFTQSGVYPYSLGHQALAAFHAPLHGLAGKGPQQHWPLASDASTKFRGEDGGRGTRRNCLPLVGIRTLEAV